MAERSIDAISLLTDDHKAVKKLFREFEEANERSKGRLAEQIREELEIHTQIEEEIFYPETRSAAEEMIAEAIEEHHVVDALLMEIEELEPGALEFDAKMKVLIENVEHHAEEEEKELFPKVKKAMGEEAMRDMGQRMSRLKTELKRQAA